MKKITNAEFLKAYQRHAIWLAFYTSGKVPSDYENYKMNFVGYDLSEVKSFKGLNLSQANLSCSKFESLTINDCIFYGTNFYHVDFKSTKFKNCDFFCADLVNANLENCVFSSCSFKSADMYGVCLKNTIFENTLLQGAKGVLLFAIEGGNISYAVFPNGISKDVMIYCKTDPVFESGCFLKFTEFQKIINKSFLGQKNPYLPAFAQIEIERQTRFYGDFSLKIEITPLKS